MSRTGGAVALLQGAQTTKLPDTAVVRYHLRMAQWRRPGNKDAVKRELQDALKLQGSFPEARRGSPGPHAAQ